MGEPVPEQSGSSVSEFIGNGSEPREVKHLSTWRKRKKFDFLSSGERKGTSLNPANLFEVGWGLRDPAPVFWNLVESCWKADS